MGEWVDGIARCGVMQPEGGRSPSEYPIYPALGLVNSDSVLQDSVTAARAESSASGVATAAGSDPAQIEAPALSADDIEELRRAFDSASENGRIPADVQVWIRNADAV